MIESYIQPFISQWLDMFLNPQKRIYWLYILTALVIGFLYFFYLNRSFVLSLKKLFSYENWCSISARADYLILLFNSFLMIILSPRLLTKSIVALGLFYYLSEWIPEHAMLFGVLKNWQIAFIFTLVLFILDDFSKYWVHRWLHTVSFLWPFHRVHHSATSLNFFTVFRTHPVEAVLFSLRNALVQGFVVGIFFFLFGDQVNLMMILGANLFSFLFNILGSNLRHSPVALPYPSWLEKYFISPAQHHIHHSSDKKHHNKNFGIVFSCWDRWFGSFCHSEKKELNYGVNDHDENEHRLWKIYFFPFYRSYKNFILLAKRLYR